MLDLNSILDLVLGLLFTVGNTVLSTVSTVLGWFGITLPDIPILPGI